MNSKNRYTEEWSDARCLQIASQDNFPIVVKDLQVQKNIIKHYFNFYLGGKIPKGLNARDITLAVIAIMPISRSSEEFIWPETEYSENGKLFFLTADDKLKYEVNSIILKSENYEKEHLSNEKFAEKKDIESESFQGKFEEDDVKNYHLNSSEQGEYYTYKDATKDTNENDLDYHEYDTSSTAPSGYEHVPSITNLKWYRLKPDESNSKTALEKIVYGPVENANFCKTCNHLLDAWEFNIKARITLKFFFAMAALYIMRSKAKTFQNVKKYFATKFINTLYWYTTPYSGFLRKSWKIFHENDSRNQIMFAKLVILSLQHPDRVDKHEKINIIKYAVLSHTAYFGMGLINMLQQLAALSSYEFKMLFQSLYSDKTAMSWNRVNGFFKKYLNEEAKQFTFHWARVIEPESCQDLSCSNNYELAVVIAVFIEHKTNNPGVWQSEWVSKGDNLKQCKELGYKMYNDFQRIRNQSVSVLLSHFC